MLIPLGKSVGLTTISLSLIKLLHQKNVIFFKPFLEKLYNIGDTSYILKRYYSISCIESIIDNIHIHPMKEKFVQKIVQDAVDLYYLYRNKYDIIFIEGVKSNQYNIHDLNIKFLQHIDAEIIFYDSGINFFLKDNFNYHKIYGIKNNILGVIKNFCNVSINFYNDLLFFRSHADCNDYRSINIPSAFTAYIPWNREIINFSIYKIFKLIKIKQFIKNKYQINLIDSFICYNHFLLHYSNNMHNTVLLIPFYVFLQQYDQLIYIILNTNGIHSIILTNCNQYDIEKIFILMQQIKYSIIFFYTECSFNSVVSTIHSFKIKILHKNARDIDVLLDYIIYHINRRLRSILYANTKKSIYFSPVMFQKYLIDTAKNLQRHILLPEGTEKRIIHAASILSNLNVARFTLLGDKNIIYYTAKQQGINLSNNIDIIDPKNLYKKYVEKFFILRAHKGITWQFAEECVQDNMVFGSLLLRDKSVDGIVCGVNYTTSHVIRTALQLIGMNNICNQKYNLLLSSAFFMLLPKTLLIYSDCAVNINPNAQQLFNIAYNAVNLAILFGIEPKIAMLSYSTGNSGTGHTVDKVREATILLKKIFPHFSIEGPIQYDAAINSNILSIKLPNSSLHDTANIFIFPDLNSGNITYKAVQQSLNISSIGPILQGLMQPVNDLSRGATISDILYTILVTIIQSKI
ncbi:phosphate acetyltransferase [Buchnera aphidicola (Sarucallis kahawaluokalani)]|uniref:Phosphate acetyltransferase n=2 Tax=Buchnera aphidicola TaxID=9 RepID=A0A4D6Y8E8_9GAMM|nr:phosphate acetyltransferase [Buchnera aphidicola (Sarucallis kahawaluokalani)]